MLADTTENSPIYLDYHATTPVDPRVVAVIVRAMTETFGNANSVDHDFGFDAATLVDHSREEVAALLGGDPDGVHFTSGSSESIRLSLDHAVATQSGGHRPLRIAASVVEHRATLDALAALVRSGKAVVRWIPVDSKARLEIEALESACAEGVDLVCVMAANNEVGTIYPTKRIAELAGCAGAAVLIDATQSAGREPFWAAEWGATYVTVSAHKIYGPKGIGAVLTAPETVLRPAHGTVRGTGAGTPNVPGIAGLGEACRLRRVEMADDEPRIAALRDHLETLLLSQVPGVIVNGDPVNRLTHNLHVSAVGAPNDAVVARLRGRVAISTGAACTSGAQAPSHVLRAMGLPAASRDSALRIGLGKFVRSDQVERAATEIAHAVHSARTQLMASAAAP